MRLRHVSVDTMGADSDTFAIEAEGGSDLFNVRASNQPGSDADRSSTSASEGRRSTAR